MTVRHLVLGVNCSGQSLDRGEIQRVQLLQMAIGILDTTHRGRERQVENEKQRQNYGDLCKFKLPGIRDQERCDRRSAEVVKREPKEVRPPDLVGVLVGLQRNGDRDQPAVEHEIDDSEDKERREQARHGGCPSKQRGGACNQEEDVRSGPARKGRRGNVERETSGAVAATRQPEIDHEGIESNRQRTGGGTKEENRGKNKDLGDRDRCGNRRELDRG